MSLPDWRPVRRGCYGAWELAEGDEIYAEAEGDAGKPACYRIDGGEAELARDGLRAAMRICEQEWGLVGVNHGLVARRIIGRLPRKGAA